MARMWKWGKLLCRGTRPLVFTVVTDSFLLTVKRGKTWTSQEHFRSLWHSSKVKRLLCVVLLKLNSRVRQRLCNVMLLSAAAPLVISAFVVCNYIIHYIGYKVHVSHLQSFILYVYWRILVKGQRKSGSCNKAAPSSTTTTSLRPKVVLHLKTLQLASDRKEGDLMNKSI